MCSPEKQYGKCSPCVYLTIGGTSLAIISMVTYMYLTVDVSNNVDGGNKTEHVLTNTLSRQGSDLIPSQRFFKPKKICKDDTCGTNANCYEGNCACPPRYAGDPTDKCERLECVGDNDCEEDQECGWDYKCVNLCQSGKTCGRNATCDVISHIPMCSCPAGYTGNPFQECKLAGREKTEQQGNPCVPSPCGPNSVCRLWQDRPVCSCVPGYVSSPPNCRPECESDKDCGSEYACRDSRCVSPCIDCGENAHCETSEHRAVCNCPTGYSGDPLTKCIPECDTNVDCPNERLACVAHSCVDPCDGDTCGIDAHCSVSQRTPICSCPANTTGDPFVFCRPLDWHSDYDGLVKYLCSDPSPCGKNATCSEATDGGSNWFNCTCPSGFSGNPYKSCQLIECEEDSGCQEDKTCVENQCVDPCKDNPCGLNAVCTSTRHRGICTCREGTIGNAFKGCFPPEMVLGVSFIDGRVILRPPFDRIYSNYIK